MGQPVVDKETKPKRLRKNETQVLYKGFPIKRKKKDEYHVYMGFPTQDAAQEWVAWGVRDGFLKQPHGQKNGVPKKP